ncbi:MAG: hypothetical protein R2838_11760 [Caldilineaceae bacterium]
MNTRSLGSNRIWLWLALAALLALGFWLRWAHTRAVSLHVDEFTTLWAATLVQEHGVPHTGRRALHAGCSTRMWKRWPWRSSAQATRWAGVSIAFGLGSIIRDLRARAARVERTGRAPGCGGVDAAAGGHRLERAGALHSQLSFSRC